MGEERRKHERFREAQILEYEDGFWVPVTDTVTKDISAGGICFYSDKELKVGTTLKVKLYYDVKMPPEILHGKVVWSRPNFGEGIKEYLNGFLFNR